MFFLQKSRCTNGKSTDSPSSTSTRASPAAPAPAPPPHLEEPPPPLHRAACRGSAPCHGLARAPSWPSARKGGGGRAKSGRPGARGGRRHRRSRTSRPPDIAAAATGRARGRRIWPAPPWKGTGGGSRRGRSAGRRNSAATLELQRARAAALPSPKTIARRRRRRRSSCGRGELVLLRVGAVLIAGVCAVSCSSIPAARRTRSSFEFGSLQASAPQSPFGSFPRPASSPRCSS